jgi:hypothetical protein
MHVFFGGLSMPLQIVSGTATNVNLGSQLAYAPTAKYGPVAVQQHLVNFRLNGRPVRIKVTDSASISEGDRLVAAGKEKQGTLEALAVKNVTTGAIHHNPYQMPLIGGIVALVISIPLMFMLIGIPLAAIAAWVIYRSLQIKNAVRMAYEAPLEQAAASA